MPTPRPPTAGVDHWSAFFDEPTLVRAEAYLDGDRVQRLRFDQRRKLLHAVVTGSRRYDCEIDLIEPLVGNDGLLYLVDCSTDCTCPVGDSCKHAAAVLALAEEGGLLADVQPATPAPPLPAGVDAEELAAPGFDDRPPERRRGQVKLDEASAYLLWLFHRHGVDEDHEHLRYVLGEDRNRLTIRLTQPKKTGGWRAGKVISQPFRLLDDGPAYLAEIDRRILLAVSNIHQVWYREAEHHLDDCAQPEALLLDLVASGRCHLDSLEGPVLHRGEDLPARLVWHEHRGKWQALLRDADDTPLDSCAATRLTCADDGTVRRLLLAGSGSLAPVLRLPPLAAEELQQAWPRLRELVPALPEPPAAVLAPRDPPRPVLMQRGALVRRWGQWSREQAIPISVCYVGFRYRDQMLRPGLIARTATATGTVIRDLPAELDRLAELRALGFRGIEALDGLEFVQPASVDPDSVRVFWRPGRQALEQRDFGIPEAVLLELRGRGWELQGAAARELPAVRRAEQIDAALTGAPDSDDWFQLELGVVLDDEERLDLLPVIADLAHDGPEAVDQLPPDPQDAGRVLVRHPKAKVLISAAAEDLRGLLRHLFDLFDSAPGPGGLQVDASRALSLDTGPLPLAQPPRLRALVERLQAAGADCDPPRDFTAELRPYQLEGLAWLQRLRAAGIGGILADDMGLGKTVQALAHIQLEAEAKRLTDPVLVICPASVVGTWQREAERFAPHLRVGLLHGNDRHRRLDPLPSYDLLVTTYATLQRDRSRLRDQDFHLVICDEAQAIKNAQAKCTQAVRALRCRHRLCLSGTPLENHLGELWSLFHWLAPGLLGSQQRFDRVLRRPIERVGDTGRAELLRRRIAPFILRRTKDAVARELPPKTEQVISVDLDRPQRRLYESVRAAISDEVRAVIRDKGLQRSQIEFLDALLKLRQICCDPRLLKRTRHEVTTSAKLDAFLELVGPLVEDGRRVLVFSQFASMITLLRRALDAAGIANQQLTGRTRKRQPLIDAFQAGEVPVFLISLKAGGTGLTLTAADTVIHYDPWWNPAVEDQATDRAHRIGQDKPVHVYRLVTRGTVEERVRELQERKRALAAGLYDGSGQAAGQLEEADVELLLSPLD